MQTIGNGKVSSEISKVNANFSFLDTSKITYFSDTTANWATKTSLVSAANVFYIYTDYQTITQGSSTINIAGVKIGDGNAYVVDLPFVTVSQAEKEFWNNKVRCYMDTTFVNSENLIFTTH